MGITKNSPKERQAIRQIHKARRAAMPKDMVQEMSRQICARLLETEWYRDCEIIYGYYPLGNEVDCRIFLEKALTDGKKVALPRVLPPSLGMEYRMDFYEILSMDQVAEGSFHVMEPEAGCRKIEEAKAVILVPGVVFDVAGNRYGYGKGYYDRYFSRFPELFKAALAYENQMEQELLVSDTDVKMDCIYTESCIYMTV